MSNLETMMDCKLLAVESQNELILLKIRYRSTYKKCLGYNDDRTLFNNMLSMLVDAIVEFNKLDVQHPYIKSAFHDTYKKKNFELSQLENSLKERGMV